jgi:putative Holliday junction resolvase
MLEGLGFGCDVGTKRMGLAVGGGTAWIAPRPLGSLSLRSGQPPWDEFDRLVDRYAPSFFVFGLATAADGRPGRTSAVTRLLAEEIRMRYSVAVHFVDEAYSTEEGRRLGGSDPRRRGSWRDKDATAACIILASWLAQGPAP